MNLLSLRAADVDFQTRFITLGGEKNKNRKPRIVPISAHTVKLLLQLINENKKHFSTDRIISFFIWRTARTGYTSTRD